MGHKLLAVNAQVFDTDHRLSSLYSFLIYGVIGDLLGVQPVNWPISQRLPPQFLIGHTSQRKKR